MKLKTSQLIDAGWTVKPYKLACGPWMDLFIGDKEFYSIRCGELTETLSFELSHLDYDDINKLKAVEAKTILKTLSLISRQSKM